MMRKRKPVDANDGSYGGMVLAAFDATHHVVRQSIMGEEYDAIVTAYERITDDPDHPEPYWLWTLQFSKPVRLYDGTLIHQTFIRMPSRPGEVS